MFRASPSMKAPPKSFGSRTMNTAVRISSSSSALFGVFVLANSGTRSARAYSSRCPRPSPPPDNSASTIVSARTAEPTAPAPPDRCEEEDNHHFLDPRSANQYMSARYSSNISASSGRQVTGDQYSSIRFFLSSALPISPNADPLHSEVVPTLNS